MNFSEHRPKVYFKTFGCRTNIFDTQVMISNLKDFDVTNNEKEANVVIINSCTVTNSADTTARSYINSLKKLENSPKVIFTGVEQEQRVRSFLQMIKSMDFLVQVKKRILMNF